jgi:hypothetical protein
LHEVVALQKNVYNMYGNFDLLDMSTCIHTHTSNSNTVSFKYVSCCNIHPQMKNKSGSQILDLVPRFKENFLHPAVFIYLSCTLLYLFIYLCYTHWHCSGSDHRVLKHITNSEQGTEKDAQGNGVIYDTILECRQRYRKM